MKVKQVIPAFTKKEQITPLRADRCLRISEFFYDTIQGEGVNIGCPAMFMRLQGCSLDCIWCDTTEVWRVGNVYSFGEIFSIMGKHDLFTRWENGHHLVFTGGSPLKQQIALTNFIEELVFNYGFLPYIEMENECVYMPNEDMLQYVSCWNNSPKLSSAGNPLDVAYNREVIKYMSKLNNSWFKFVITCEEDWIEIEENYLKPHLIQKPQVILMPEGCTKEALQKNQEMTVDLAIEKGVRYISREHINLWDKKTGV